MSRPTSLRILLVEDNELDARTMTKQLGAYPETNFLITRAPDLASAKALLEAEVYHCILLDLSLPDSAGLVSVEALSAVAPDCPIVVLTGLDDPSTALEAVKQGAQDYLSKQTADAEIVARSIRYAVARHHSDLALRSATDQLGLLHDRERIARDLHDTVIQQLFATGIGLQSAAASVTDGELHTRLVGAIDGIDAAIHQLREAIFGLHAVPQGIALAEAIEDLADEKSDTLGFQPMVTVDHLPEDLAPMLSHEAIQVVGEALSNIAKHAVASAAKVEIGADQDWLTITIIDNGKGLSSRASTAPSDRELGPESDRDPGPESDRDPGPESGAVDAIPDDLTGRGLNNMEERAKKLGGRFHIGPGSGGGTKIEWTVPVTVS